MLSIYVKMELNQVRNTKDNIPHARALKSFLVCKISGLESQYSSAFSP